MMMKNITLVVTILLSTFLMGSVAIAKEPEPRVKIQQDADSLYEAERYRRAKAKYVHLARLGDRYAQYRLSTMYLDGKAGRKDLIVAYAWAEVAAQDEIPVLLRYRDLVWDKLGPGSEGDAARKASQYLARYNDVAVAKNLQAQLKKELRNCTGSRLGTSCYKVKLASMPIAPGVMPGNGKGEAARAGAMARIGMQADAFGKGGVEGSNMLRIQNLQELLVNIDLYLDEHAEGTVEFGEFEVLENADGSPKESSSPEPEGHV